MKRRDVRERLSKEFVGVLPCGSCGQRPMTLPGDTHGVCIGCYAAERNRESKRAAASLSWVSANFVADPCMGCGGSDVHANGWLFWCEGCGMRVRVAL